MTKRFLAGALLLLAFAFDAGAQSLTRSLSDGTTVRHLPDPGEVIIEFTAAPLLSAGTKASADFDQLFARLERDLSTIEGTRAIAKAGSAVGPTPMLRHRYTRVFAGASATVSPESLLQIRALSYVRTVHPDRVVTALLQESVEQVGAPVVWEQHGVVVAVIDSGIDYMHPALGGGFGVGHKVRGGRDLVNNDSDPMDDHGHGTHVAGIVAANGGGLTGVAPEATLLAYKALDASGSGRDSFVLAAIEEAVRERADIVNMSLGRPAAADDPVVRAIENAAASGTLFCVAAGNTGAFLDIGSPANAPSAVTVGAIDREGRLAYFSSKGPVVPTGAMKPEIVAPGVQIVSARNGGGLRTASGTSMAAPHVAGVAALLREVHPEWSPAMLRAALINGARGVDAEVMAAGAGSVHAGDAVRKNLDPSANSLSFGISDQAQQPWVASRTITLTNRSDAAQSLSLAIDGLVEGIVMTPSASSVTINPGASASIDVELRLDHTKVPSPEFGSLSFGGFLRFSGDHGAISIPWSFVKASRVRVRWSGSEIAHVKVATARMMVVGSTTPSISSRVELFIGAGDASLWLQGESAQGSRVHHVIRENVDLSDAGEIVIDPSHAPHEIRFAGTDVHGRLLSDRGKLSMRDVLILHPHFATDLFESIFYLSSDQKLFVSALPSTVQLLAFERAFDTDPAVTWSAQYEPVTSVDGDVALTITPGAWKSISARGVIPTGVEHPYQTIFAGLWITAGRYSLASISRPDVDPPAIVGDTVIEAWVTSPTAVDSRTGILVEIGDGPSGPETSPLSNPALTAEFTATADGIVPGHDPTPRISSRVIPSQERFSIGDGPAYPNAMISGARDMMSATIRWSGPHGEDRIYDAKRTQADLYDASGAVIASGTPPPPTPGVLLGPAPGFQMFSPLPAPGAYTLLASTSSFKVAGLPARGTLRAAFNSERSDPAPPALTSLRIDDGNGRTTASVMNPAHATLTFSAVDIGTLGFGDIQRDRTTVQLRTHGAANGAWSSVTPVVLGDDFAAGSPTLFRSPDGVLYRVNLGAAVASMRGAVDVRIRIEDAEGNSAEYTVEPAFVVTPSRRRAASN
jgi:hypothetical protein